MQAQFPYRLIKLIRPEARYSAARFRADALREMADIAARGHIPLLVGGTMQFAHQTADFSVFNPMDAIFH